MTVSGVKKETSLKTHRQKWTMLYQHIWLRWYKHDYLKQSLPKGIQKEMSIQIAFSPLNEFIVKDCSTGKLWT